MEFRSVYDLNRTIVSSCSKIPQDVDVVVGIPRSGMLAAELLCLYLNKPLVDLQSFVDGRLYRCGTTKVRADWPKDVAHVRRALVVDDSCYSGKALKEARARVMSAYPSKEFVFLVVYVAPQSRGIPDVWLEQCSTPRLFEWNYLHQVQIEHACFDIDGVLCEDPTEEQNDDGVLYRDFLLNAAPKAVPSVLVGHLVTSRLEKYREETVEWLDKHHIEFGELHMMPYTTKEERLAHGNHGEFKGRLYRSIRDARLFVESDPGQAEVISRVSGKLVFCTGDSMVHGDGMVVRAHDVSSGLLKSVVRKVLPPKVISALKEVLGQRSRAFR